MLYLISLFICFVIGLWLSLVIDHKGLRPGFLKGAILSKIILGLFVLLIGYQIGIYSGQKELWKGRSYWDVRISKYPDHSGPRFKYRYDTAYYPLLQPQPAVIPAASPKYFIINTDTVWQQAVFSYTKRE
jgi:hypothetical protein